MTNFYANNYNLDCHSTSTLHRMKLTKMQQDSAALATTVKRRCAT